MKNKKIVSIFVSMIIIGIVFSQINILENTNLYQSEDNREKTDLNQYEEYDFPSKPRSANPELSNFTTPGNATSITMAGNFIFVADGEMGVQILNISSNNELKLVTTINTPGYAYDVDISGNYAYVADGNSGVHSINITDIKNSHIIDTYDSPGTALEIKIWGNIAFIADGDSGLRSLNITNPANLITLGSYDTTGNANGVDIAGNRVYIADGEAGLQIINITSANNLELIGTYNSAGSAMSVEILGNTAYLADDNSGLLCINIVDYNNPILVGSYNTPGNATDIYIFSNMAFIADNTTLQCIDISNPSNPLILGNWTAKGNTIGVFAASGLIYLATNSSGIVILEYGHNTWGREINDSFNYSDIEKILVYNDVAYIAEGNFGLRILNVTNPNIPVSIGSYTGHDDIYDLEVSGNILWICDYYGGLIALNISNPAAPSFISSCVPSSGMVQIEIDGDIAYLLTFGGDLYSINITNPYNSTEIDSYSGVGWTNDMEISGNTLFCVKGYNGIEVINVTDPYNLDLITVLVDFDYVRAVEIFHDTLYIADYDTGLFSLNISDLENIGNKIKIWEDPWGGEFRLRDLSISGNILSAITESYWLNWGNPHFNCLKNATKPQFFGFSMTDHHAMRGTINGEYIYIGDTSGGLHIFDTMDSWNDDLDGDGLSFYEEEWIYNTSSGMSDTDGDTLSDWDEINIHETDPLNPDSDYDTMPDDWEVNYNLNPINGLDNISDFDLDLILNVYEFLNGSEPNNIDSDDDELTDYEEIIIHGTYPNRTDSDYDGMPDKWELDEGFNPMYYSANDDNDTDGLSNRMEYYEKTDPNDDDTDDDGLDDGLEYYTFNSDPNNTDTDEDGMPDGWEVNNSLNLLDFGDKYFDLDEDGISNYWEYKLNLFAFTNDSDADSILDSNEDFDSDGLVNGLECKFYQDYLIRSLFGWKYLIDPMSSDSNNNGISDGDEDFDGDSLSNIYELTISKTNILNIDSDGDNIPDNLDPHPTKASMNSLFGIISIAAIIFILILSLGNYYTSSKFDREVIEEYKADIVNFKKDGMFFLGFSAIIVIAFTTFNNWVIPTSFILGISILYFMFFEKRMINFKKYLDKNKWAYYYYIINICFLILLGSAFWWLYNAYTSNNITFEFDNILFAMGAPNFLFLIPIFAMFISIFVALFTLIHYLMLSRKSIVVAAILTTTIYFFLIYGAGYIMIQMNLGMPIYLQGLFGNNLSNMFATTLSVILIPAILLMTFFRTKGFLSRLFLRYPKILVKNEDYDDIEYSTFYSKKTKKTDSFIENHEESLVKNIQNSSRLTNIFIGIYRYILTPIVVGYVLMLFILPLIQFVLYFVNGPESVLTISAGAFIADNILKLTGIRRVIFILTSAIFLIVLNFIFAYDALNSRFFKKSYYKATGNTRNYNNSSELVSKIDNIRLRKKHIKKLIIKDNYEDQQKELPIGFKIGIASMILLGIGVSFIGDLWWTFTSLVTPSALIIIPSDNTSWLIVIKGIAIIIAVAFFIKAYFTARKKAKSTYQSL